MNFGMFKLHLLAAVVLALIALGTTDNHLVIGAAGYAWFTVGITACLEAEKNFRRKKI